MSLKRATRGSPTWESIHLSVGWDEELMEAGDPDYFYAIYADDEYSHVRYFPSEQEAINWVAGLAVKNLIPRITESES